FRDAIQALNHTHVLLAGAGLGPASNDQFWIDPFTQEGARFVARALPVMHDLRLDAEHALASLLTNSAKAKLHADTVPYIQLAAMRLDFLGMKVQFAREITSYYWDAYSNQAERPRARRDLSEISATNGRLQDLRDATERIRQHYRDLWAKENRPYWLGSVLIRYDEMSANWTRKIGAVKQSSAAYGVAGTLTPPDQLGFFTAPYVAPPVRPGAAAGAAPGAAQPAAPQAGTPPPAQQIESETQRPAQPRPAPPPPL